MLLTDSDREARNDFGAGQNFILQERRDMPHSHQHQLAFEIRNSANWIAVASAEHVCIGQAAGVMQVCHGKSAPLRRIHAGDRVVYYSPTETFRGRDKLQAFTAIGIVTSATPDQAEFEGGFRPFRHNVAWLDSAIAPIAPLLHDLEFPEGRANWGAKLRFGLVKISADDMATIARAVQAAFSEPADQNGRLKTRLGTSSPASTWPNATGMPPQAA